MRKLLKLSEKISKYLIAAILVFIPLLPKFPLIKVPGTYVAIRFEDMLMLLTGLILIPKFLLDFKSIKKDKIVTSIFIFFGITFVSLISGIFLTQTVDLKIGFLHWARRIEYMIPFLAVYLLTPKERIKDDIVFYFKILLIVIILLFFYGIGQRFFNFPVIITQNEEYSKGIALRWTPGAHINSTFAGHYDLSAFVVLVMPIFLSALFLLKGRITKFLIALSSGMGLWLLINSVSRTAQVSYLLAISVTLLLLKKIKGWIWVVAVSLIFMFMSSGLDARFSQAIKVLYEHITTGESFSYVPKFIVHADDVAITVRDNPPTPAPTPALENKISDVSISIRYNVEWPRAIRAFSKNPLLGTGYSSIDLATDNDYLRMLGETGILGFFAFALVILNIGKVLIRSFQMNGKFDNLERSFVFGILGGAMGTFVTALLIDLFEASKFAVTFWLLLGCSVIIVKSKLNEV